MAPLRYRRHRFPPEIIQHAIWLYLRFTLSYRDVEDLLAERGLDVSYETVRRWVLKFGPLIARKLRQGRRPSARWHLDEMVVRIAGERMYLWRAVDHEGEILDSGRRGNGPGVPFRDAPVRAAPPSVMQAEAVRCAGTARLGASRACCSEISERVSCRFHNAPRIVRSGRLPAANNANPSSTSRLTA
jgi:hypothetical protein